MSPPVARYIAKTLVEYEGCRQQLKLSTDLVDKLQTQLQLQDSIVLNQNTVIVNQRTIIEKQKKQLGKSKDVVIKLDEQLVSEKKKSKLYKIISGIGVGISILTLL